MINNLDIQILLALNSLLGSDNSFNQLLWYSTVGNPLVRGFPIFFSLVALWFTADSTKSRSLMLVGLLATCVATVVSVWLQHHITPHVRPLLNPALHLNVADPQWTGIFDRQGSFPSDSATLYFSLAAVIFGVNRLIGSFCFVWVFATVGAIRVIFGWHYPSDVVGSFVLGPGCVYLFNKIPYFGMLFERALKLFENRMYVVHALLFVFLADAFGLFGGLQQLSQLLVTVLGLKNPHPIG
jgi:membrane-associated phospholipid phosphatase